MSKDLPAITGDYLIKILKYDGWQDHGRSTHGITLKKQIEGRWIVTTIPTQNDSLPQGTLSAILSVKQTRLERNGLLDLINRYEKRPQ